MYHVLIKKKKLNIYLGKKFKKTSRRGEKRKEENSA